MFTRKLLTTAIALTGSICTLTALADTPVSGQVEKTEQIGKISEWMGKEVKDQQGNSVGDIADFAVNFKDATIPYAVVELEGMFNSKHIGVPLTALSKSPGNAETLSLAVSEAQWKAAQTFGSSDWPATATLMTGPAVASGETAMPAQRMHEAMMSDQSHGFKTMDHDGDGYLSDSEAQSRPGLSIVRDWDTNRDGRIDSTEFAAFELAEQNQMSKQEKATTANDYPEDKGTSDNQ